MRASNHAAGSVLRWLALGCTAAVVLAACGSGSGGSSAKQSTTSTTAGAPVPATYRTLYNQLAAQIAAIKPGKVPAKSPTVFATDLTVANSNLGPALLGPNEMTKVDQQLAVFENLGIRGVTIQLNYPLLDTAFPDQSAYVAFYKGVADDIQARKMTLGIETNEILTGTPYSSVQWNYQGLTTDSYAAGKAAMANTIIATMAPAYLALETEADTAAHATGLPLNDPTTYASVVSKEVAALAPHPGTLVGAGPGSWQPTTFATQLAKIAGLDYIDTHVYPINATDIANAEATSRIAHAANKQAVMDEAWLYKGTPTQAGGPGGAGNLQAHESSYFSFFAPLDQQFLDKLVALTRADGFLYFSANQSFAMSAYLAYEDAMASQAFAQITHQYDAVVVPALQSGSTTDTGNHYQQLISG